MLYNITRFFWLRKLGAGFIGSSLSWAKASYCGNALASLSRPVYPVNDKEKLVEIKTARTSHFSDFEIVIYAPAHHLGSSMG
jgi:hypothetical protein